MNLVKNRLALFALLKALCSLLLLGFPFSTSGQGTWKPISAGTPTARWLHTAVWSGTEVIVWGGINASGLLQSGSGYNPDTEKWHWLPINGAPDTRADHGAIWATDRLIIWGGFSTDDAPLKNGGTYFPNKRN